MLSIIVGLGLLMALAYFGWSIIWVAPLAAAVVAIMSGLDVFDAYTLTYMDGLVGFVKKWFPIFLLGAVFGKLMEETGAARSVAKKVTQLIGKKRAILGVLIAEGLSVQIMSIITGSASGGMGIALSTLGNTFYNAALATGISPDALHRIAAVASGASIFPNNGAPQGLGRIINIASINGLVGFAGKAAYNSAKHGVIGLTKVAALEAAEHGITVNALCPGYVDTPLVRGQMADLAKTRNVPVEDVLAEVLLPLVPQKKLLEVSEIADYALFLASDKARSVTGQAVVIDGGYTAQ